MNTTATAFDFLFKDAAIKTPSKQARLHMQGAYCFLVLRTAVDEADFPSMMQDTRSCLQYRNTQVPT